MKTHYRTLQVSEDASPEVIRAAYRALAISAHPDKHGGSPEATARFQAINEAHRVLSDAKLRPSYDAALRDARAREDAGGFDPGAYPSAYPGGAAPAGAFDPLAALSPFIQGAAASLGMTFLVGFARQMDPRVRQTLLEALQSVARDEAKRRAG